MALKDTVKSLIGKMMQNPYAGDGQDAVATMETGERRGFRPGVPQKTVEPEAEEQSAPPANEGAASFAPEMSGMQPPVGGGTWGTAGAMPTWNAYPNAQAAGAENQPWSVPVGQQPMAQGYTGYQQPMTQGYTGYQQPMAQGYTGYQQPMAQGYTGYQQPMAQGYTGYQQPTGQQPPVNPGYTGYQPQVPSYGTGYQQPAKETGAQQGFAAKFQQIFGFGRGQEQQNAQPDPFQAAQQQTPPPAGMQTGYAPQTGWNQPQQSAWQSVNANGQGYERKFGTVQERRAPQNTAQDNVRYMNQDHFVDENGTAYSMVLRIAQPLSTSTCYRMIEFMRNGEAVLVNTEMIQDDQEMTRCLDLLFGAAYAMNFSYTRVASRCLYLVSPRSVNVMPYASVEKIHQVDSAVRWPGSDPTNPEDNTWQREAQRRNGGWQTGYQSGGRDGVHSPNRRKFGNPSRFY